jgi:Glycosyltransferase family 87
MISSARTGGRLIDTQRLLLRGGIAAAATVLVSVFASYAALLLTGKVHIEQSDLLVYYSASHLVLTGHGPDVYNLVAIKSVEASAFHALALPRTEAVFLYPPFVALALAPFASFGFGGTYLVWLALNGAVLAVVVRSLIRYLGLRGGKAVLFTLGSLSFFPVIATLFQGQVSILLLGALTGSFFCLRSGRDELAGLFLGLALLKPPYVLPFLVLLLVQRRWRTLSAFAITAVTLALIPMLFLGAKTDIDYLSLLRQAAGWHTTSGGFSPRANENLWGFFHLILSGSFATLAQLSFSLAAIVAVAVVAVRWSGRADVAFAATTLAALLINPHVLIHDLALLLLPVAIALHSVHGREIALPVLLAAGYGATLFAVPLALTAHFQGAVFVMAAWLAWCAARAWLPEQDPRPKSEQAQQSDSSIMTPYVRARHTA